MAGYEVLPAIKADLAACNAVCRRVHGFDRAGEFDDAIGQGTATVIEHLGHITGYITDIGYFAHAVGETNEDLKARIGAAGVVEADGHQRLLLDEPQAVIEAPAEQVVVARRQEEPGTAESESAPTCRRSCIDGQAIRLSQKRGHICKTDAQIATRQTEEEETDEATFHVRYYDHSGTRGSRNDASSAGPR